MRLYNATSCTPCVSTNPRTTNKDCEEAPASLGGWRIGPECHKKISTRHGDNQMDAVTRPSPKHSKIRGGNFQDFGTQERDHGRPVASKQHKREKSPQTKQGHRRAIQPMFNDSDHLLHGQGYLYGKPDTGRNKKLTYENHRANLNSEGNVESSSSTLITTRSIGLQQHDDTVVTVLSHSAREYTAQNDGVVTNYPIQEAGLATGESSGWDTKEEISRNENEGNKEQNLLPVYPASSRASSSSGSGSTSNVSQGWTLSARDDSEYDDHDGKYPKATQFRKEDKAIVRQPKAEHIINFFPLKKAPLTVVEKISTRHNWNTGANLGVSSRFPTQVENTPHKQLEDDETWANFGDEIELHIEDLIPTSSRGSDESPFPIFADEFDLDDFNDPSFTDLISNKHYKATIEENNWKPPKEEEKTETSAKDQVETQAMASCKTLPEENEEQPSDEEKQPRKLLGPILEARFTRSYLRRLKRRNKKSKTRKNGDRYDLQLDDEPVKVKNIAKPKRTQKPGKLKKITLGAAGKLESITELVEKTGNAKKTTEPTGTLPISAASKGSYGEEKKEEDYESEEEYEIFPEVEWVEHKPSQSDDGIGAPVPPRANILSWKRRQEFKRFLDATNLSLDDLVVIIDAVDASFGLTADQIISLRSLIPTPAEKKSLLKLPLDSGRLDEEEEFMAQMVGVPELGEKIEWLLFQCQFPIFIKRFCDDLNLFERACDEILTSPKLEKVLGIINLLGNQLVGRTPAKKKETKISISSLIQMLDEVKASLLLEKANHSQPFLSYALTKIQSSNPSLLNLKQDMPLLSRTAQELDGFYTELKQFEDKLDSFRHFALLLSLPKSHASKGVVYADEFDISEELRVLESSTVGKVVVEFYLKIDGLYQTVDATERAFATLCSHFNEDDDNVHGEDGTPREDDGNSNMLDAGTIMKALVRFCELTVHFRESIVAH